MKTTVFVLLIIFTFFAAYKCDQEEQRREQAQVSSRPSVKDMTNKKFTVETHDSIPGTLMQMAKVSSDSNSKKFLNVFCPKSKILKNGQEVQLVRLTYPLNRSFNETMFFIK